MKKDREIMHNDKKDSELIAEYYDKDAGGEEVGVHNQDCKKYRC